MHRDRLRFDDRPLHGGIDDAGPTALTITNPTIIEGNGASSGARPAPEHEAFTVAAGGSLTLSGATLRGGKAVGTAGSCGGSPIGGDGDGGAIYSVGTVVLDSVTLTANQAQGGNAADCCTLLTLGLPASSGGNGRGGAVFSAPGASLSITNCTIAANTAQGGQPGRDGSCFGGRGGDGLGGGVFSWNAVFDVRNCTIAGTR